MERTWVLDDIIEPNSYTIPELAQTLDILLLEIIKSLIV